MKEKILAILDDISSLENKNLKECGLPENVYYLNDTDILCLERDFGESRYPYEMDGLTLWACSGGHICANESNLVVIRNASPLQQESNVEFWGGIKSDDKWIPISITGVTKQLLEPFEVKRYTVYAKRAAYYIADTKDVIFALRASITSKKQINFSAAAINKTTEKQEVYIASYIDPHLRFENNDTAWSPLLKQGRLAENGSYKIVRFTDPGDGDLTNICVINKTIICENEYKVSRTIKKADFMGGMGRCIANAKSLVSGRFVKEATATNSVDMPVSAEIVNFTLNKNEEALVNSLVNVLHDNEKSDELLKQQIKLSDIEEDLRLQEVKETKRMGDFEIKFGAFNELDLNHVLFNRFLKNVQKQIDLCALGKNYAGDMLGFRDVFQQLTAANIWNEEDVRKKIILCLNFIMSNGRTPRQFAVPTKEGIIPKFDIRQFIDQGIWIVETVYKYISNTDDYSILKEECSYYEIIDEKKALYKKSDVTDTVLQHLLKITAYLISNIDERTGCLKILYGDWNDAVNGIGQTDDEDKEFGTGVSVMATLQLYKLLKEMYELLDSLGGYEKECKEYRKIRHDIAEGLEKFAVQRDGKRRHIIHGWGDKGLYNVGSLRDSDDVMRFSINSYSFWCISEMLERDTKIKEDILLAYDRLDSKYGLKTFDKFFPADMKGIGRIVTLTPGTAENSCTYVHAATFAIMALFIMGEPERAWAQIMKILPITHKNLSKTPFVMPNSYCHNDEFQIDGESMGDWHTGSGAVLMRSIYEYALGIKATLGGIKIDTPAFIPTSEVSVKAKIKNCNINFIYKNQNRGERKYFVNGNEIKTKEVFIKTSELKNDTVIKVID